VVAVPQVNSCQKNARRASRVLVPFLGELKDQQLRGLLATNSQVAGTRARPKVNTRAHEALHMKIDFHASNCGSVCNCGEGEVGRQSLEELEFTRSACAAAMNGQLDKLDQLLSRGSGLHGDGTLTDSSGYTPLHYAARSGHAECARLLLRFGAVADAVTNGGATALHRAAFGGHTQVVVLLCDARAGIARQDSDGDTPLHKAAAQGHQATTHVLASRCSAAAALRNRKGRTPEDAARSEELGQKLRAQLAGQVVPSQEADSASSGCQTCS
jgi:hypothetical protein